MADLAAPKAQILRFGPFELDVRAGELRKHGIRLRLREQSRQILHMLLEHPGEVVLRDEIRLRLWPNNTIVEFDHGINAAIQKLRDVLGEPADQPRYIETLARRGYRFLGEVDVAGRPMAAPAPPQESPVIEAESVDHEELTGKTIAHYRILDKLGEGGMGVVYRAEDLKLGRQVALKFLPRPAADLPEAALLRFEREGRAIASMNHPHICQIYEIGPDYLVMELVEGQPIKGPIPRDEAMRLAGQIADALDAAHRKGITHRDLKPANILMTRSGVKLLDFGLAKVRPAVSTAGETVTEGLTGAGTILGTLHYMSPEQVEGKEADARSDIFSFGLVLYEMITGKRAFEASSPASVIAAILEQEAPAIEPAGLNRIVKACLAKDPGDRFQSARDLKRALEWSDSGSGTPAVVPPTSRKEPEAPAGNRRLPWIVAAVFSLTTGVLAFLWLHPKPADPGPSAVRFPIPLPAGTSMPSLRDGAEWVPSPDGRYLAFAASDGSMRSSTSLWVRPLGSESAHRLDKTEGANFPFWSPDSQSIGFFAEEKLKHISVSGGSVQTVCPVPKSTAALIGDGGAWHRDGYIVFASGGTVPLMRVAAVGGVPAAVTTMGKDETRHSWPQFLPDGRLLYFAGSSNRENSAIYLQELGSAKRILVMKNTTRAVWAPPGYLLFVREGTLFAKHINPSTFQVEGEPLAVAQEIAANESNGRSAFAVSQNGVLAYRSGDRNVECQLTWRDREGKVLGTPGKPGAIEYPRLSPDQKSVALSVGQRPKLDVWVMDLASGVLSQMTRDGGVPQVAVAWSPDSQRLAVSRSKAGLQDVSVASGKASPLTREDLLAQDWSPDGRSILVTDAPARRLSLLSLVEGGKLQTILDTPALKYAFRFSPDGKYVAYHSAVESGYWEIYVAAFPSFAVKRKVSTGIGYYPVWSASGKELFYAAATVGTGGYGYTITSVDVRGGPTLDVGIPKPLFPFRTTGAPDFSVSADGKRFLLAEPVQREQEAAAKPQFSVVLNWAADIK